MFRRSYLIVSNQLFFSQYNGKGIFWKKNLDGTLEEKTTAFSIHTIE